jgi:hypothetical protein
MAKTIATLTFSHEKDTKGTYKYAEDGDNPVVGSLYIRKDKVQGDRPDKLKVVISAS